MVREGHGKLLQPDISIPSTTLQKPSHDTSMSHIWPSETMTSGKFAVQNIPFDHPSVSLGTSSAGFYTLIHLPPLVGIPSTRKRGQGIHCRCNLRCKTKSSNQKSFRPWSNIEYLLCIFKIFVHFFASMHANHCPPGVPIQQLNEAHGFSPLQSSEVDSKSKDRS